MTTETRSAFVICCFTNFFGGVVGAHQVVVAIEVRSKKSTHHAAVASLFAGGFRGGVTRAIDRNDHGFGVGCRGRGFHGLDVLYEKIEIFCPWPSSAIVNWSAVVLLVGFPERSVTSTSIRTRSDDERRTIG